MAIEMSSSGVRSLGPLVEDMEMFLVQGLLQMSLLIWFKYASKYRVDHK